MNRLQKKCFIVSTGLHLLLVIILLVGPAFLSSNSKTADVPLIDFVPLATVDSAMSGGGSRTGGAPPPLPQESKPPEPVKAPDPVPQQPKPDPTPKDEPRPKDDSFSVDNTKPKQRKPDVSLKMVTRKPTTANQNTRADQEAKERADEQRRIQQLANTVSRIGSGLSSGVNINPKDFYGPGGGGVPYANFLSAVKKVYWDAWIVPDGINDDSATTSVSVTIAKDGHVVSANIVRRSGNAAVDHSVQMAIDRVKFVAPLPEDSKDTQRTVTIDFNVKAKLLG